MRKLFLILFSFSTLLTTAQIEPTLKKENMETYRIKFQQAPDGTLAKTEEKKNLDRYFYDKKGRLIQSSKYNFTRDGKLQTPVNTVYTYDSQSRLLSDSTDRVKSCYYYNDGGLLKYSTQYNYKTNIARRIADQQLLLTYRIAMEEVRLKNNVKQFSVIMKIIC